MFMADILIKRVGAIKEEYVNSNLKVMESSYYSYKRPIQIVVLKYNLINIIHMKEDGKPISQMARENNNGRAKKLYIKGSLSEVENMDLADILILNNNGLTKAPLTIIKYVRREKFCIKITKLMRVKF